MDPTIADDPLNDPMLRDVPELSGFKVLDRRYVIYSTLGQGGMGVVYRGRHTELEIDVAIKCLDPTLARRDRNFVERFKKEARSAASIQHENVVRVVDVADASGLHYLVMEYVRGEDARKRVARKQKLKIAEAAHIALGAARGAAAAHDAGLVHRDIKPDNVLIGVEGEVKIADLGLAKQSEGESGLTYSGATMGTPRYMPPEQFGDAKNVGFPADVYALGATLYFLLTGVDGVPGGSLAEVLDFVRKQPFPDPRELRPDAPDDLAAIVQTCTQKDPNDRPQHARDVEHMLEKALRGIDADLSDPDAGTKQLQSMVSPPPPETIAKIRLTVADSGRAANARKKEAPEPEPETGKKNKLVLVLPVVGALALAGWGLSALIGGGGDEPNPLDRREGAGRIPENESMGNGEGSLGNVEGAVVLDQLAPSLGSQQPTAQTTLTVGAEVDITLTFDEDVSAVEIDGSPAQVQGSRAWVTRTVPPGGDDWSIDFTVSDAAGNERSGSLSWPRTVAGTPSLVLTEPSVKPGGTLFIADTDLSVKGRVSNFIEEQYVFTTNGTPDRVPLFPDGLLGMTIQLQPNEKVDFGFSAKGVKEEISFTVVQDSLDPVVEWVNPPVDGFLTNADELDVAVNVVEANLLRLSVNDVPLEQQSDGRWTARLPLDEGDGVLNLLVEDKAGRTVREQRMFSADRSAPVVVEPAFNSIARKVLVGEEVQLRFRFDEEPASVSFDGSSLAIDGDVATGTVTAPEQDGPWNPQLDFCDDLANCGSQPILFTVEQPAAIDLLSAWADVVEKDVDPRVVRDKRARQALAATGLPWKVRDRASGIIMLLVPPGGDVIGASPGDSKAEADESPAHTVRFTEPFYLGMSEVTQDEWETVMESSPAQFKGGDRPVEKVTFGEIGEFLGKTGLRLPLECEWEYACRAGSDRATYTTLSRAGWYDQNAQGGTSTVGAKDANAWGFVDMLGNVWEFCANPYDAELYERALAVDPVQPDFYRGAMGEAKVVRGGSWRYIESDASASSRRRYRAGAASNDVGFRVARNP